MAASSLHVKVESEPVAIGTIDDIAGRHDLTAYDALIAAMAKAGVPAPSAEP